MPKIKQCFYLFLIFCLLFLGGRGLGIFSLRNISAILLFASALFIGGKIKFDKCEKLYIVYLIALILSNLITGYFVSTNFIQNFLSYHLICLLLIISFPIVFNNQRKINGFISILVFSYILNSTISILQYFDSPIGWSMGVFFNPRTNMVMDSIKELVNLYNKSYIPGITGFVVENGYYCTVLLPIVTYSIYKKIDKKSIIPLLLLSLGCYTIFITQQRMAFFLGLAYILFVIYYKTRRSFVLFGVALVILGAIIANLNIDMGRLTADDVSSDARMSQVDNVISFFNSDNFLFGADPDEAEWGLTIGHNTILDSLRRGGFITMFIYCCLFISLLISVWKTFIFAYRHDKSKLMCLSLSSLIFLLYSFFHSSGVQSGAVLFWLMYLAMRVQKKIDMQNLYEELMIEKA